MQPDVSDRELIDGVIARDPEAASLFVARFYRFIVAIAGRYGDRSGSIRLNVPQIVIANLWEDDFRRLRMWRGEGDFVSYLGPIVRRVAIDYASSPWNRHVIDVGLEGDGPFDGVDRGPNPGDALLEDERRRTLLSAIEKLPPRDREVLERRWLAEESIPEIAAALGINDNAVHQALHRALRKLRTRLTADAPELFKVDYETNRAEGK